MEDRNRNKGNQSHNQDWEQNRNRYQDQQNNQQGRSNQGFSDLDGDGFLGNTGGFYGGTSYLGANYDDWNTNQGQGNSSDQYREQGQDQNRNRQNYQKPQYRSGQSYSQGASSGNQNYQGMSGQGDNTRYGRGFDNYQDDQKYNRQSNNNEEHHHYGAGGSHNRYGGWADNRISREQEQREEEYRRQAASGRFGNQQSGDWNRSSNQGNYGNRDQDRSWWDRTTDKISSWFGDDDWNSNTQRQHMSGPHRGKGPRGYQRSADRIRDDIHDRLHDDPYIDASEVEVEINQNEVILKGYVDSREAKRRAEDLVESISGVQHVENRLRVGRSDSYGSSGSSLYQNTGTRSQDPGKGDADKDITV